MFIHKSRLEHLLPPSAYFSAEQHELEVERLFKPGWHFLATTADLPKNGDFVTFELFGQPLILRNFEGRHRCFVNVCAHRHALLTSRARGNTPRLACQYHGWEYGEDGRTRRIPDARCFRPWDRENARLKTVRTETCGELIFVSLAEEGPGLAEFLGPYHAVLAAAFASPYRQCWTWDATYDANWKVFIENTLESYHVPVVHPNTLKKLPPEEISTHELNERYTWYRMEDRSLGFLAWCAKRFGQPATYLYEHHNIHPNINYSTIDGTRVLMSVYPVSPTTCRHRAVLFTIRGDAPGPFREAAGWLLSRVITAFVSKVNREDLGLLPDIQRGLEASHYRGVIGTREERIYAFQKYIVDRVDDARNAGETERLESSAAAGE